MVTTSSIVPTQIRSTDDVRQFVNIVRHTYLFDRPIQGKSERRAVERMYVTIPIEVTPLNLELTPLSYSCHAVTRDLSIQGIGLVSQNPVELDYLEATFYPFAVDPFKVVCKVVYCKNLGYYYQIGCEFLTTESI